MSDLLILWLFLFKKVLSKYPVEIFLLFAFAPFLRLLALELFGSLCENCIMIFVCATRSCDVAPFIHPLSFCVFFSQLKRSSCCCPRPFFVSQGYETLTGWEVLWVQETGDRSWPNISGSERFRREALPQKVKGRVHVFRINMWRICCSFHNILPV